MKSAPWWYIDWDEVFHRRKKNKEIQRLFELMSNETDKEKKEHIQNKIELVNSLLNWKDYKDYR